MHRKEKNTLKTRFDWRAVHEFPMQCLHAGLLGLHVKIKKPVNEILIAGMGGSGLPADILQCVFGSQLKIFINRDYTLPEWVNRNTLAIVISYSGNTEETLEAITSAVKKKCKIMGMASGGKLEKFCKREKIPFIKVPSGLQPRDALGYQTLSLINVLEKSGILKKSHSTKDAFNGTLAHVQTEAQNIANFLRNHIPVIYSSQEMFCTARIAKIKINENAKQPAFWNVFPELNHNEMVGFTKPNGKYAFVFLQNSNDHPRIRKRMHITKKLFEQKKLPVKMVELKGKTKLERIFYGIHLFNYVSYYLAEQNHVDPMPVKMVEEFKKKLREQKI